MPSLTGVISRAPRCCINASRAKKSCVIADYLKPLGTEGIGNILIERAHLGRLNEEEIMLCRYKTKSNRAQSIKDRLALWGSSRAGLAAAIKWAAHISNGLSESSRPNINAEGGASGTI